MPNRILKESICTSDTINELTSEEEVFFYRLLVNCDDYGRLDGRPSVIRSKCFPLRLDSVKDKDIQKWLQSLVRVGLIRLYNVDGKPYLHITTWDKHQQVRAKRSKYPAPDEACEHVISDDINCQQSQSDDGICPRNPIQSESNPNPESESESKTSSNDESRSLEAPKCDDITLVMDEYNRIFADCWARPLKLTNDRKQKIKARLASFTPEDLITAMINIRASPFHCGENDRGQIYATPEFIFRNDATVDKWLKMEVKKGVQRDSSKGSSRRTSKYDDLIIS